MGLEVTYTENAHHTIGTVLDGESVTLWARRDHADWLFLGGLDPDVREFSTQIAPADILPLAQHQAALEDGWDDYCDDSQPDEVQIAETIAYDLERRAAGTFVGSLQSAADYIRHAYVEGLPGDGQGGR